MGLLYNHSVGDYTFYFFLILAIIAITTTVNTGPADDLLDSNFLIQQIQMAVRAAIPEYNGQLSS